MPRRFGQWLRGSGGLSRLGRLCFAFIFPVVTLAGCSSNEQLMGIGPGDAVDAIRDKDLTARFSAFSDRVRHVARASAPKLFPGEASAAESARGGEGFTALAAEPDAARGDSVEVNFEQADIQTVAKALLGDALGLNFVVDQRIQGPITIVSASPIPRKDILPVFESVLRMSNGALLRDQDIVRIMPASDATGSGAVTFGGAEPGFGVTIVPLRHVSATALVKAVENFVVRPTAIRADSARNIVLIQGTSSERRAALDVIAGFDVEWLRNQSVGLYPLKSTAPDTIIRELDRIFETSENGRGSSLVGFQPISRMNAVMAIARTPRTLERVTQWIRRLDRSDPTGATVRVYRLENGSATKITKILNEIFVGKGAGATSDSASSQLAPGTAATQTKLDQLSAGSSFGNGAAGSGVGAQRSVGAGPAAGGGQLAAAFETFGEKKDADAELKGEAAATSTAGALPKGMFQHVRITADSSNNSVVIFSNQEDYRVIERSIRELDRPQLQVAIEATVAEVSLTDQLQYGVQYYLGGKSRNNASLANADARPRPPSDSSSSSVTSAVANLALQRVLPGFNLLLGPEAQPHVILNALSTLTSVKVLSAPSLVVTDNQPALLQVGQQIPVSMGSATVLSSSNTIVNSIQMRDTGVILKVWPHVHANGMVQIEVEQEISNAIDPSLTPTISQRRVHSTVSVASGQTVMLGGMISEQENDRIDGLPGLRRIAYLGDLFGNTDRSKDRQEIIVFIKPQIIRNGFDSRGVAEEFLSRLDTMRSVRRDSTEISLDSTRGRRIVK